MTKQSTYTVEKKTMNPEYTQALEDLWSAALDMFSHSQNELSEIYRISRVVYLFASQKAKIDRLREMCALGSEKHDLYLLNKVTFLAEKQTEEKCFDLMWEKVAKDYNGIVQLFCDKQSNDNIILNIMSAEEILQSAAEYYSKDDSVKFKLAEETAKAMIDL